MHPNNSAILLGKSSNRSFFTIKPVLVSRSYIEFGSVGAHCDRLLSVEHILVHCSKFQNQRRKYHHEGKSIDAILDDVDVGGLVGYLQEVEVFNII